MMDNFVKVIKKIIPEKWYGVLEHYGFRKYLANTGWMFFGQMFSLLVSFFIGAWLARYLGPKNYGILNYSLAYVGMFTFIAQLGVGAILFRDLIKYPKQRDELMGTSFFLLLFGSSAAFLFVVISALFFESSGFNRNLIILYAVTFLWSPFNIIESFFQALVKAKKNVFARVSTGIVISILKVIIILLNKGVIWLMLVFVFESLLGSILAIINYRRSGYKFSYWKFNWKLAKNIMSGGWLWMLAASASYLFMKVDQVMIKAYLGEVSVGLYAAAVRLVEIWYFIPGIICSSLFPAIINAKNVDEKKYHNRLKNLFILLGIIAVLIAVITTVLASWLVNLLFDEEYLRAVVILRIYVWSGIGLFVMWGLQQYYLAENRLKMMFYLYLFSMILNIGLNLVLIPRFTLTGAAWATFFSYSLGPIIIFVVEKFKKLKYTKSI